jgi:acyl-CoA synthetase (AMP-forming)/AMP-acid ligase II
MVDLNSEAVPVALFGASLAGLPFAPINYRLTDDRLNAIVARLAPGIVRSV